MKIIKTITLIAVVMLAGEALSQDAEQVKRVVKKLSSEKYHGRAYTNNGADKAAKYIQKEFKRAGLSDVGNWFQPFEFELGRIHTARLSVNDRELVPGAEFVARRNCPSIKGQFNVYYASPEVFASIEKMNQFLDRDLENCFVALDYDDLKHNRKSYDSTVNLLFKGKTDKFIMLQDAEIKDFVVYGRRKANRVVVSIRKKAFPKNTGKLTIDLETSYGAVQAKNVLGWYGAASKTDSTIILCGHYDHLGEMGPDAWYPGADDNALAIGSLIEIANYLTKNKVELNKNILFVAFSAEEAGLLGAKHFVANLPINKDHISYTINLDMIGFGNSGLYVWNGEAEKRIAGKLEAINNQKQLIDSLFIKENNPNSDHFPMVESGIPAVFITTGTKPSVHYHTVFDTFENTTFAKIEEIMKLVIELVKQS
ncbi:MAG: M28 family peptidase [Salinivirgaceae bacterium]|jgi:aminopeptidase YwaD|nr:M28 family peptidase [Salinivirgaceae bacterium]